MLASTVLQLVIRNSFYSDHNKNDKCYKKYNFFSSKSLDLIKKNAIFLARQEYRSILNKIKEKISIRFSRIGISKLQKKGGD